MIPVMKICSYALGTEADHQRMDVNEFHRQTVEVTFHHSQDLFIMLGT